MNINIDELERKKKKKFYMYRKQEEYLNPEMHLLCFSVLDILFIL